MEIITVINSTKLTGQTVIVSSSCALASLRGSVVLAGNGLGLDATGLSAVSGLGNTAFAGSRDERPTKAPKALAAAVKHGEYARANGAGHWTKQDEQLIEQAMAAFMGATAIRIRAFRGPEPWRERT